ncbi:MAG: hypothetical protein UZ08_BCD001001646 [Candidatus Parvibacillus calidus]|nr:MAG: hypothetical protein UZ08_BCD001001646 [Candidatus Parvibacillus calidus]
MRLFMIIINFLSLNFLLSFLMPINPFTTKSVMDFCIIQHSLLAKNLLTKLPRNIILCLFLLRIEKHFLSITVFNQFTQHEESCCIAHSCCLLHVVGYDDDGVL